MDWQALEDRLDDMQEGLCYPTAEQVRRLDSMPQGLRQLLKDGDQHHAEALRDIFRRRFEGVYEWDPEMAQELSLCLRLRFEWAHAVLAAIRGAGIPPFPPQVLLHLLTAAWEDTGLAYTHEGCLEILLGEPFDTISARPQSHAE